MSLIKYLLIGIISLTIIIIILASVYNILYCILSLLHLLLKPCCCRNTPNDYDLTDDFVYFFDNISYFKITLPNIKCKCRKKNTKIKPNCDNFHIIVVNPHNQFQIGTVSTVVNSI